MHTLSLIGESYPLKDKHKAGVVSKKAAPCEPEVGQIYFGYSMGKRVSFQMALTSLRI